ncbi:MAG: sensor histidine kinase [Gemmatimonadaceae bacterium]
MSSEANEGSEGGRTQNTAESARPRTVLIADSNAETRGSLGQVLRGAGWTVLSAGDAETVLQLAGQLPDAIVLSLSERMELLQRVQAARTEAVEANRVRSEFLATMSHELRTPLNAVLGYSQLLDMGVLGPVTESQHEHLDRLRSSSVHLLALVNDVLDLSKVDAGRMQVAEEIGSFRDVTESALGLVRPQAIARNITLVDECNNARETTYVGDPNRVRQILANLLSNSIKFSDPGARVNVTCGTTADLPPNMEPKRAGPWAFASVRDTGMGIGPDELERMFEPFVQGVSGHTRERGGTGLGLAMSRRFARLMHGGISVESERGQGSNFTLWLPAPADPSEANHLPAAPSEAADARARLRHQTFGDIAIPTGAAADEMEALGRAFATNADGLTTKYVRALREQGIVPYGHDVTDTHLRDHAGTLFAEFATALATLGALRERAAALLHDGSELQRTIAELHGAQRYRLGWSEHALERDAEVLSREVVKSLEGLSPHEDERGAGYQYAAELLRVLTARAAANSLRAHRTAAAADAK